ncbi:MAG: DUF3137 domain-containing protein [Patescibacteria group bacterium]
MISQDKQTKIQYFANELSQLQQAHSKDIKYVYLFKVLQFLSVLLFFLALYFVLGNFGIFWIILLPILLYAIALGEAEKREKKYYFDYKDKIVYKILQSIIPNVDYYPKQGFDSSILFDKQYSLTHLASLFKKNKPAPKEGSGLFSVDLESFKSEDYIKFNYKDWYFEAAEVEATTKIGDKKNGAAKTDTVFKGVAIKLTLPVYFNYNLIIQPINLKYATRFAKEIRLESPTWERIFYTYCDDEVFVRYILNPAVMVRILDLYKKYPGIGISFKQNHIFILWGNDSNMFEPTLWVQNAETVYKGVEEIITGWETVLDLVRELELGKENWTRNQFYSHTKGSG